MDALISWWNHLPEHINPVFIKIGGFQIRYYGLMYMLAFVTTYYAVLYRIKKEKAAFTEDLLDQLCLWAILGVLLGARLGYVLFYNLEYFWTHPLEIVLPFSFEGGMRYVGITGLSYHGALLGVVLSMALFCRKHKISFWKLGDFIIVAVPLGYTLGRIGNFLNNELYGRVTEVPWGMYFPGASSYQLRHPSQLYEAFFEGIFLFLILWPLRNHNRKDGFLFALYLIGYGLVRFCIEFFRQPDEQLGLVWYSFSMGQLFCLMMVAVGGLLLIQKGKHKAV